MEIRESGENYLETIYILTLENESVRSIDVANRLSYSKASVSRAVNNLVDKGLLLFRDDSTLEFTKEGLEMAKSIYERHVILTKLLESFGVDPETAEEDACKIEHVISSETFDKIKRYVSEK